jgi:uncharacterized membrane protein YtjA (UPF0391 family)
VSQYAVALLGIAVIAEALGLGGIPALAVRTENILLIVLLVALIAKVLAKFVRRRGLTDLE